jgi:hypothetical protein
MTDLLDDLNRRARERGQVEIVFERPKPRLVKAGEVVPLRAANQRRNGNGYE